MSKRGCTVRLKGLSWVEALVAPNPRVRVRTAAVCLGLAALAWAGACADGERVVDPPRGSQASDSTVIVSDPLSGLSPAGRPRAALSLSASPAAEVVYVSLRPGTASDGQLATVRNLRAASTVTAPLANGGFDPVPVTAAVDDTVEVVVRDASGAVVWNVRAAVAARRAPVVVRTDPPPRKRDVPLNARIVIVFSEPVAGSTLTPASVRLFRGTSAIAGTVRLLEGSTAAAVFIPDAPLDANADYRLVVTDAVRDLEGDALAARDTVEFATGTTTVGPTLVVTVLPDTTAVAIGSQVQLVATARDTNFTPIAGRPVTWTTDGPGVATVSATGLVTAQAQGVARVRAEVDGLSAVAVIFVSTALAPVASVDVTPQSATVLVGGLVQLTATPRDAAGNVLPFRTVAWESRAPAIAGVTAGPGGKGVVTRLSSGTAIITATSEGKTGTATITMGTVGPYARIAAGADNAAYTCAVTTDARAWCWGSNAVPGSNAYGRLGNGTTRSTLVPSAVAGSLGFLQISANAGSTCALTPSGVAYCWGDNGVGQLGIGLAPGPDGCAYGGGLPCSSPEPIAVAGGLRFAAISVGPENERNCAVSAGGAAYCWGSNRNGALGIGTTTGPEQCTGGLPCSTVPVAVAGGLTFTTLALGVLHACALTTTGAAYCWGWNNSGVLGDGTTTDHASPVQVAGGLAFVALSAGWLHTCGLTSDGIAYCWGSNNDGELGVGTTTGPEFCTYPASNSNTWCSSVPVPVPSGRAWAAISAGGLQTCALTPSGEAYCWGYYQLDGTAPVTEPLAVAGGLTFASLSAGLSHTCGVTVAGIAYCWGWNEDGELGIGSAEVVRHPVPVRVAGQP